MEINVGQILAQLVIFLGVLTVLKVFVFTPLLHIHEQRHKETKAREIEAADIMQRGQAMVQRYNQSLAETRAEADRKIQTAVAEASAQTKQLLGAARAEGQEIFSQKKAAIQAERERLAAQTRSQAENLADDFLKAVVQ